VLLKALAAFLPVRFLSRCSRLAVSLSTSIFFTGIICGVSAAEQDAHKPLDPAQWRTILDIATTYVDREWAGAPLPFKTADLNQLHSAPRKVFAHYFTPFPLSIDNRPAEADYYAQHYLKRTGENNKFYDVGGYLRERPLPVGPFQNAHWQKIDLAIEVLRAQRIGIDGFGVDLLALEGVHWQQTLQLFEVVSEIAHDFAVVPEPDMFALKDISEAGLAQALATLIASPAAYHLPDGRALVIPFNAEAKPPDFWRHVGESLTKQGHPTALILDFVDPSDRTAYEPVSYGYTTWGARDPLTLQWQETRDNLRSFLKSSGGRSPIMAPVAPQDTRPKEATFWEAQNTSLYRALWTRAIESPAQFAHLITWNDYSEASEISPSSRTQYVFYDLAAYYISWFKSGTAPPIGKDAIFYAYRSQVLRPDAKAEAKDKTFDLRGRTGLRNDIEMLAFLTAPAMMEIETGGRVFQKQGTTGLNSFTVTAQTGRPIFRLKRGHELILETPGAWIIESKSDRIDPLYAGGSSTRIYFPKQ